MTKKNGLKYTGGITGTGSWQTPRIPARDLSADEVKEFGGKKFVLSTGLYEEHDPDPENAESDSSDSKEK